MAMENAAADLHETEELKDASLQVEAFRELPAIEIPVSADSKSDPDFNMFDAEVYGVCAGCGKAAVYDAVIEYGKFSCYLTESHAPPHTDKCRDEGPAYISGYRRFKQVPV